MKTVNPEELIDSMKRNSKELCNHDQNDCAEVYVPHTSIYVISRVCFLSK